MNSAVFLTTIDSMADLYKIRDVQYVKETRGSSFLFHRVVKEEWIFIGKWSTSSNSWVELGNGVGKEYSKIAKGFNLI